MLHPSRLFLAGVLCLVMAAVLSFVSIPRMDLLPAKDFQSSVLAVESANEHVVVQALSQPEGRAVFIEWQSR